MGSSDPRGRLQTGGNRGRVDRPSGWADSLFAGRSRADKEAEQDAMLRVLLVIGGVAAVLLMGPLWAGPTAEAWKEAHGGLGPLGPRYPLGAVLGASPVAMGLVAFLVLAFGMVITPRVRQREPKWPAPPPDPEPLRAPLVSPERHPRPPCWP